MRVYKQPEECSWLLHTRVLSLVLTAVEIRQLERQKLVKTWIFTRSKPFE